MYPIFFYSKLEIISKLVLEPAKRPAAPNPRPTPSPVLTPTTANPNGPPTKNPTVPKNDLENQKFSPTS